MNIKYLEGDRQASGNGVSYTKLTLALMKLPLPFSIDIIAMSIKVLYKLSHMHSLIAKDIPSVC